MSAKELLEINRDQVLTIAAKHGARNVRVFGSAVRGDDRPDSDIDFLVEMEPGRSLFDMGDLKEELQELLGRKVDIITESSLYWLLRRRILSEASPL